MTDLSHMDMNFEISTIGPNNWYFKVHQHSVSCQDRVWRCLLRLACVYPIWGYNKIPSHLLPKGQEKHIWSWCRPTRLTGHRTWRSMIILNNVNIMNIMKTMNIINTINNFNIMKFMKSMYIMKIMNIIVNIIKNTKILSFL